LEVSNQERKAIYLVTGAAGFIGYYLSKKLLEEGCQIVGIDNLNDYYDKGLKLARLEILKGYDDFTFLFGDISDKSFIESVFKEYNPEIVVNLAAQAGVRYSIENPDVYIQSNVVGFYNILEACRRYPVKHLLYASSSSVYGASNKVPFSENDPVDHPVSLYAATKKSNELMAYTYSHLYKIPATGLRFFTVYGPMGRPDMAYYDFTNKYFKGEEIKIFNNGDFEHDLYRDFTYVEDIVEGITRLIHHLPSGADPHIVYNIGNHAPVKLMMFINALEKALSKSLGREVEFKKTYEPIKPEDVPVTYADTNLLEKVVGFRPITSIEEGLQRFTDWYVGYYGLR
jgi:UDP-glucuronate 4-epimerase